MTKANDNTMESILSLWKRAGKDFLLYKKPHTEEIVFLSLGIPALYTSLKEITSTDGYLMAPFTPSQEVPIALYPILHKIEGIKEIETYLTMQTAIEEREWRKETSTFPVTSATQSDYQKKFDCFLQALRTGNMEKLVLSVTQQHKLSAPFAPIQSFLSACVLYPTAYVALISTELHGSWLTATPELLLEQRGEYWKTMSLAGTLPKDKDGVSIVWDEKNQLEQQIVSNYITEVLKPYAQELKIIPPHTQEAGELVHLCTDFSFQLKEQQRLGELLDALYPTPAICGLPKKEAHALINTAEGYERGMYSGIIGELSAENTALYVNLRCLQWTERSIATYAGSGLLRNSTVDKEWEEVQRKQQTILSAVRLK